MYVTLPNPLSLLYLITSQQTSLSLCIRPNCLPYFTSALCSAFVVNFWNQNALIFTQTPNWLDFNLHIVFGNLYIYLYICTCFCLCHLTMSYQIVMESLLLLWVKEVESGNNFWGFSRNWIAGAWDISFVMEWRVRCYLHWVWNEMNIRGKKP